MYVWFDALINYLSGIAPVPAIRVDAHGLQEDRSICPCEDGIDPKKPLSRFWPANMHIVGKVPWLEMDLFGILVPLMCHN